MRTFVAIEVSDQGVLNSVSQVQAELNIKAKPVEVHNMHFTVQFLGEVSEEMVRNISSELSSLEFIPFSVSFVGVGVFPKPSSPRVIWVGTNEGADELEKLAEMIRMKLSQFGFQPDKKFKPHLTVFRIKHRIGDISVRMKEYETVEFGTQAITKIKLKRSILSPKGPEYSDLLEVNENER